MTPSCRRRRLTEPLTCLLDSATVLVADASTAINLNATEVAEAILGAMPHRIIVLDTVIAELEEGRSKGRSDADKLKALVKAGRIEIAKLGPDGSALFETLVVGPANETLDDGEAATLAYAIESGALPLIDEYKANRLSARRFPALRLGCTVDLFAHPNVERSLGRGGLEKAVLGALLHARMQVPAHRIEWVVRLIGTEKASTCSSLPVSVRNRSQKK